MLAANGRGKSRSGDGGAETSWEEFRPRKPLFRTPLEPTIAVFTALSSSCHCLAPAPVPACRRRAACLPPSRNHEALPPAGPATHCFPLPSPPASIIPVRLPRARTSRTGDRAGDDRHTSTPERAPAVRDRPAHAQSVGSEPEPARSARNACSSVPVDTACASLRIAGWRAIKSRGVWDRARSRPQVSLSELGNGRLGQATVNTAAAVVGDVKVGYDALAFLYTLRQCTQ